MNSNNIIQTFLKIIGWASERSKIAKGYGTSDKLFIAEVHAIENIGKMPGISQRILSDQMGITKGRMSIIITHLEDKKLVIKQKDEMKGKEIPLTLTNQGLCIFKHHQLQEKERFRKINTVLEKYTQEDIDKFNTILEEVLQILQNP